MKFILIGAVVLGLGTAVSPWQAMAQRPLGIDVSKYQTTITWSSVKGAGIVFAWAKATEGTSGTDAYYTGNAADGKAAGVYMGAYHYAHPELNTASDEASHFWSVAGPYIKGDGKSMMPMIDIEGSAFSGHVGATSVSDWINQWCNLIVSNAAASGITVKPAIYVSACNAVNLDNTVAQWIPWIANYNGQDPQTGTPWSVCSSYNRWGTWVAWQYTSTGSIPGVPSANCDHDVFNGTTNTLVTTLVIGPAGNGATLVSSSVPGAVLPGQSFTATITMKNSGGTIWTNSGATPYQLGSQNPQDNTTWGLSRVNLASSPVNPGANATFTFTATAPMAPGNYPFVWKMIRGTAAFGQPFTNTINVGLNNATVVSSSVPNGVGTGQTFTATITMKNTGGTIWTNTGANAYKLGSQSPQDNTTWGFNRVALPASPVTLGQNATFTFTATAPMAVGNFAFAWKMLEEGAQWFGNTFTTNIGVVIPGPGTNFGSYTLDTGNMDSTSRNASYVQYTACGANAWYSYGVPESGSNCTVFNRDIRWIPTQPNSVFTGRGYITASAVVPDAHATATVKFFAVDSAGNDLAGPLTGSTVNECAYSCSTVNFFSSAVNVTSFGGFRSNTQDDGPPGSGGCNKSCGTFPAGYGQMRIQAARWQYMDDWTCLGPYASSSVSDTANRSFSEASLYLYPAVDATHGNVISTLLGLDGNLPGRVTTGDCNNSNTLNFGGATNGVSPAGNAAAYGNATNADSYGFAWVFAPAGASPQFVIGSDDGNRLWVNGVLRNNTNATRGLTRDQDATGAVALPAGWSRVLFKVHNFEGGFQGTVGLRNGSNLNLNEPAVNYYNLGGYYSYGIGYEQDAWYPQIVVSNFYGASNLVNGADFYGNNTTVAASGFSSGQGPVPYSRTMQYQWGYGLGNGDTDYASVSGTPTSANWSHSSSDVTGHRRFHFFAVSQSGRTSFQNSGVSGGSVFQDAGNYARYYDVFIDNVPPLDPEFASATGASPNEIALTWLLPLDQGVNVSPGATESAGGSGNQDSQNWYLVGDVGVRVYRDGSMITNWGTETALNDTGLTANTAYTYTMEARDNHTAARGAWNNLTGAKGTNIAWTLSLPPGAFSVAASQTNATPGSNVLWTAVGGFGPGTLQYYRYVWDTLPGHTWTDTETTWTAGALATVPTTEGLWYLHVKGYNGADVGNGTYDYAVTVSQPSQALQILSILGPSNGTVTLTWGAVSGSTYRVQFAPDFGAYQWSNLIPDVLATGSTASTADDTLGATQRFYRVVLLP